MSLDLRVPPLAVTLMAGVLAWVVTQTFPALHLAFPGRGALAVALLGLGIICSLLGVASFRRARTTVNPLTPQAASTLVVSGIYRVTRNPMYLGFLLFLLAEAVWLAHPVALLAAAAFVPYLNRFQIEAEERALHARFGSDYANYAARVRRWI